MASSTPAKTCPICGDDGGESRVLPKTDNNAERGYHRCPQCWTTRLAPLGKPLTPNQTPGVRLGSAEAPGRDYAMALLGATIIGAEKNDVLWWQPGVSADAARIASIPTVGSVTRWEQGTTDGQTSVATPAAASADLVIANEVIQCLDEPAADLTTALQALRPDGLAIFSTDINDGRDPERMAFLRARVHRLMWSYDALAHVAEPLGFTVDARVPDVSRVRKLPRKRYIFITASASVRRGIRRYFGSVPHAPSEPIA